ncbi:putative radical SAM protein [Campylobacter phage F379]|uniref:Putative radical SAM protein n=1 Tax=Campylobacter phage F379 TaxID=2776767 RepID=A0A7L8ZK49_9CAUD|nr:radical SAM protein [Campylobacter jejuni]QOI69384.1 putative radical SAM protein [Campylobacter phage F379]RTH89485.1 hypothetical protein C3I33_08720 [Campylobacter jejuni]RTH92531.1 hypothetical protein C3I35_08095 [Campylobacter jejuni]RTI53909.1 hypothetical protein C3I22_08305 [Campylobacter jejuni]
MNKYNIVDETKTIELGLLNKCILRCPMCLRQEANDIDIAIPKGYTNFEKLIETLNNFKNINRIDMVGSVGEPTLYPHIFELLEYNNSRNIKSILSTNGSTKIDWAKLGKTMKKGDIIRFATDGSTQELHSKYRVGSKLADVLEHHKIFKENSEATTINQFIIFKYNENDIDEIIKLSKHNKFDYLETTHTGDTIFIHDEIRASNSLCKRYEQLNNYVNNKPFENIKCLMYSLNQLYINHSGHILPCDDMEEFAFNFLDKTIHNSTFEECIEQISRITKGIKMNKTCIRCCGDCNKKIRSDYPVLQMRLDIDKFEVLNHYRLTIDDN